MNKRGKIFIAEMIGTFVLVIGGCGSAVLAGDKIGYLGVSFAFGLSLLVMAYTIGGISGCHINPAVTIGLVFGQKVNKELVPLYILAQIVGAVIGGGVLYLIASGKPGFDISAGFATNGYGTHSPGSYSLIAAAIAEIILTAVFLFVIMGTTHPKFPSSFTGISVGLMLALVHLVGIPVTNTSVNPARSIGVAVFQGGWALGQLWLFIIAPLIGAILGVYTYKLIKPEYL